MRESIIQRIRNVFVRKKQVQISVLNKIKSLIKLQIHKKIMLPRFTYTRIRRSHEHWKCFKYIKMLFVYLGLQRRLCSYANASRSERTTRTRQDIVNIVKANPVGFKYLKDIMNWPISDFCRRGKLETVVLAMFIAVSLTWSAKYQYQSKYQYRHNIGDNISKSYYASNPSTSDESESELFI